MRFKVLTTYLNPTQRSDPGLARLVCELTNSVLTSIYLLGLRAPPDRRH